MASAGMFLVHIEGGRTKEREREHIDGSSLSNSGNCWRVCVKRHGASNEKKLRYSQKVDILREIFHNKQDER